MASLSPRRPHSTQSGKPPAQEEHVHHDHEHLEHSHSHSHSVFSSLTHTHTHGDDGPSEDVEKIVEALKGGGDRGSRITLVGLASNICLTASKGAAGLYMNSAALLADAGHSMSDLVGDIVTLFCWRVSRKPPSKMYPYGFGKFEVLGTATVSLLLTGGAVGIGMHSWTLLAEALSHTVETLPPGILHDLIINVTEVTRSVPAVMSEHSHSHAHDLDPNAAWFAALSIIAKEWLYRATKRVADEEHSPVLSANALHHRSDAYSSGVALVAILGSWWFPHLPLDPIGGLLVSCVIIRQSWSILVTACRQLTDASVSPKTQAILQRALNPLVPLPLPPAELPSAFSYREPTSSQIENETENLLAIRDLRAMRAGALMFVDLVAEVPHSLSVEDASALERKITQTLKNARKEIAEVRVKFHPVEDCDVVLRQ